MKVKKYRLSYSGFRFIVDRFKAVQQAKLERPQAWLSPAAKLKFKNK